MQTAKNCVANATNNMERTLHRMPVAEAGSLPSSLQDITRYVEQLLTPEQQRICDMATD